MYSKAVELRLPEHHLVSVYYTPPFQVGFQKFPNPSPDQNHTPHNLVPLCLSLGRIQYVLRDAHDLGVSLFAAAFLNQYAQLAPSSRCRYRCLWRWN